MTSGSNSIGVQVVGASSNGTSVSGATATYPGALAGVTLDYHAATDALDTSFLLSSSDVPSIELHLSLSSGLSATNDAGTIVVTDASGRVRFVMPDPEMVPAGAANGASMPDDTGQVAVSMQSVPDGVDLTYTADKSWLNTPGLQYPVTLDPTIEASPAADCTISQYFPTSTAYCGGQGADIYDYVGDPASGDQLNTLMNFTGELGSIPADSKILGATLKLDTSSASGSTSFWVLPMSRAFTPAEATWNDYAPGAAWSTPGGDFGTFVGGGTTVSATGWASAAVTNMVQQWVDGSSEPESLALYPLNSGTSAAFYDARSGSSTAPYLTISYVPRTGNEPGATLETTQLGSGQTMGVNVSNGNLTVGSTDLSLPGLGVDNTLSKAYNSEALGFGASGYGWSLEMPALSSFATDSVAVVDPDGSVGVWGLAYSGGSYEWTPPPGVNATMCSVYTSCTPIDHAASYQITFDGTGVMWEFGSSGLLIADVSPNLNSVIYTYNSSNQLTGVTDSEGRTTSLTYSSAGFLSTVTDNAGSRTLHYTQNSSGDLTSYEDANGDTTSYVYGGPSGQLSQITDPDGEVTKLGYNSTGQVTSVSRVTNNSTGAEYTTTYAYYSGSETPPAGTPACGAEPGSGVPAYGETVETTPDGNASAGDSIEYCYDTWDRVYQTIDQLGDRTTVAFDLNDDALAVTNMSGYTTSTVYDSCFRPAAVIAPQVGSETAATTTTDYPSSCASAFDFRPTSVEQPDGSIVSYAYDAYGNLVSETDGLGANNTRSFTYETAADTGSTEQTDGEMLSSKDADLATTSYSFTGGNLTEVTPPGPADPVHMSYDADGRVVSGTDGDGNTTAYMYNADDDVTNTTYQDGSTVAYTYDADGNVTKAVDSVGGTTTYAYDLENNLTSETDPGAGGQPSTTTAYTYDGDNDLLTVADAGGTTTYGYDWADRPTTVLQPGVSTPIGLSYDVDNDLTCITYPNGTVVQRAFDASDELVSIEAANATGAACNNPNGSNASPHGTVFANDSYTYNNSGVDTGLMQTGTSALNGGAATTWNYQYDAVNRLIEANTSSGQTYNYTYNGDGSLTSRTTNASTGAYLSFAYNADDEIDTSGYSYDTSGNLLAAPTTSTAPTLGLTYNDRQQTGSVNAGGAGPQTLSYRGPGQVDPVQTGNQPSGGEAPALEENVLGISGQEAAVSSGGSAADTYYTRLPDGMLLSERTPGADYYYVGDANGSIIALTNSSGAVANTYTYDPYGNNVSSSGSAPNSFGYDGGYDAQGGLILFGTRYYDPNTGSWTQQDPAVGSLFADPVESDGYTFASDDPVNGEDPTGLHNFYIGAATALKWGEILAAGGEISELGDEVPYVGTVLAALGIGLKSFGAWMAWDARSAIFSASFTKYGAPRTSGPWRPTVVVFVDIPWFWNSWMYYRTTAPKSWSIIGSFGQAPWNNRH